MKNVMSNMNSIEAKGRLLTTPGRACSGVGGKGGEVVLESLLDSFDEPQPPLPHTCPSYTFLDQQEQ